MGWMDSDGSPVPRDVCPMYSDSQTQTVRLRLGHGEGRVVISRPDHCAVCSKEQGQTGVYSLALMMDGSWAERRANNSAQGI
jgi:hypothetical protein